MQLTNLKIVQALAALTSNPRNPGSTIPTLKNAPKGAYALAKTTGVLRDAVKTYEEVRESAVKEIFGDNRSEITTSHPKWAEWEKRVREFDEIKVEVPVHQCKLEDLNLAENAIHHEALAAISFMVSDW